MPSLMGNDPDPTGVYSLLGPALSGGAAQDPQSSLAAFLAAGSAMANAGAPTLGPPPTTAQAILGALGAGRNAAIQQNLVPYMQQQAAIQQQQQLQALQNQQLDYTVKKFNFDRQQAYQNLWSKSVGAGASATDTTPAAGDVSGLADLQALPDQTRVPALLAMRGVGMSPAEAAQYARMLNAESQGQHIDPKTGDVITSSAGAKGVAQVMPDTFADMAQLHGIKGSIGDLQSNLAAGANYFHDQVLANGGDLRAATIAYQMGPKGLADVQAGKRTLPAATQDYLVNTGAPAAPVSAAAAPSPPGGVVDTGTWDGSAAPPAAPQAGAQFAGPGVPADTAPPPVAAPRAASAGGPANDPLVRDPVSGAMVPRSILAGAFAAGGTDPVNGPGAHAKFIDDYLKQKALMPTYRPTGTPGVQTSSQGQTSAAPGGTVTEVAPTDAERKALFPQVPAWQDIILKKDQQGQIIGHEFPDMGPEPINPISDEQAQKPTEQGGAGASYRTGTAYGVGARTGLVKPIQIERGAGPPLPEPGTGTTVLTPSQQTGLDSLISRANADPRISNFQQQLTMVGRLNNLAADPTRSATDDVAALKQFFKFNDPGAVVHQDGEDLVVDTGGPGQRIQTVYAKLVGGRFLTPDTMQNIVNTVNTEAEGARAGYTVASNTYRQQARARGLNPDLVTPDPDQTIQQYQTQWSDAQQRLRSGQGVGGQTAVPGAQPTVRAGTAAAPASAAPPPTQPGEQPPDRLTQAQLAQMTPEGWKNLGLDMQAHPDRYSAHDVQTWVNHIMKQ